MSKPEKRIKCGAITLSIWANEKSVDGKPATIHNATISRAYKVGDEWKHTSTFEVEDLPKVGLLADQAYRHLRVRSTDEEG